MLIAIGVWLVTGFTRGRTTDVPREAARCPSREPARPPSRFVMARGRLTVSGGAGSDQLLSGSFGGGLDASRHRESGRAVVDMRVKDRDISHYFYPWRRGWAGMLDWNFTLNAGIPLSLMFETGASESRLSLSDLQVKELGVKTGASSTTVDLPASAGFMRVHVESGAAAVKIRVPQGVAAFIQVKSALAGIHVDQGKFPQAAGGYRSADWERAANKVEIFVETGVGSIDIVLGEVPSAAAPRRRPCERARSYRRGTSMYPVLPVWPSRRRTTTLSSLMAWPICVAELFLVVHVGTANLETMSPGASHVVSRGFLAPLPRRRHQLGSERPIVFARSPETALTRTPRKAYPGCGGLLLPQCKLVHGGKCQRATRPVAEQPDLHLGPRAGFRGGPVEVRRRSNRVALE